MKKCSLCGQAKSLDAFYIDATKCDGKRPRCKECMKDAYKSDYAKRNTPEFRANAAIRMKDWRESNPAKYAVEKQRTRLRQYGLTLEDYEELLMLQGGVCAICCHTYETYHVDHDHSCCSGRKSCSACVRGLLCNNCNAGLGMFEDSIFRVEEALKYLRGELKFR